MDGRKCHCFRQAEISLLYEQSNISQLLEKENFSTLSYDYYQGEDLTRFQSAAEASKKFTGNYDFDYRNLFFYGTVGTGKSFLSGCIAKEMIENGHSVIYFSAVRLFDTLSQISFDYKSRDELHGMHRDLYQCDLLIIDDLGMERSPEFALEQVFNVIDTRYRSKKPLIVND